MELLSSEDEVKKKSYNYNLSLNEYFKSVFNPSPLLVLYSCFIQPTQLWKSQSTDTLLVQYSYCAPSWQQEKK